MPSISPKIPSHLFTFKSERIERVLLSEIELSQIDSPTKVKTRAIWDTGASATVVTQEIFDLLGLKQFGVATVSTASISNELKPTYLLDVYLKPDLQIKGIEVTIGVIAAEHGINCLIGMDIITLGDLSITNLAGKTCMSFRLPSQHEVDFVKEWGKEKAIVERHIAARRTINQDCICNSGKKFKNCHGKNWQET